MLLLNCGCGPSKLDLPAETVNSKERAGCVKSIRPANRGFPRTRLVLRRRRQHYMAQALPLAVLEHSNMGVGSADGATVG